jgi:hypothetical protein
VTKRAMGMGKKVSVFIVALAACGGATATPEGPATGSVGPVSFKAMSGVASIDNDWGFAKIALTDKVTCTASHVADEVHLFIRLKSTTDVVGPSSISIARPGNGESGMPDPGSAEATLISNGPDCWPSDSRIAVGGTLKLTSVDDHVTGSVDIEFDDGHIWGTFDVAVCDPPPDPQCAP